MIVHKSFLAIVVRAYDDGLVLKAYLPGGVREELMMPFEKIDFLPGIGSWLKFVSNGDQLSIEITEDRPLYTREEVASMIKDTLEIEEILESWGED